MSANKNRPFYKSAHHYPLMKIDKEELKEFLLKRSKRIAKPILQGVAEMIVAICEAHPNYVQYLANTLWDSIEPPEKVSEEKLSECVNHLIDNSSAGYELTRDLLTKKQKQTLYALAASDGDVQVCSAEFIDKYAVGSHATVQTALKSFLDKFT